VRSAGAFVVEGVVVCGAAGRVSRAVAEETEGLRVGRVVAGGCDELATDTRLDCADGVTDAREVAEGGRVVEGGRAVAAAFVGDDGFAAAARRAWSVVDLDTPTEESLAARGVVWEAPTLDGRGLAPGAGAALGAAGRPWEMILVTLSRAANSPCIGGHWK
jgi:hypothetical protein